MLETDKFENYNNIQIIETCHNILENIKNKSIVYFGKKINNDKEILLQLRNIIWSKDLLNNNNENPKKAKEYTKNHIL